MAASSRAAVNIIRTCCSATCCCPGCETNFPDARDCSSWDTGPQMGSACLCRACTSSVHLEHTIYIVVVQNNPCVQMRPTRYCTGFSLIVVTSLPVSHRTSCSATFLSAGAQPSAPCAQPPCPAPRHMAHAGTSRGDLCIVSGALRTCMASWCPTGGTEIDTKKKRFSEDSNDAASSVRPSCGSIIALFAGPSNINKYMLLES